MYLKFSVLAAQISVRFKNSCLIFQHVVCATEPNSVMCVLLLKMESAVAKDGLRGPVKVNLISWFLLATLTYILSLQPSLYLWYLFPYSSKTVKYLSKTNFLRISRLSKHKASGAIWQIVLCETKSSLELEHNGLMLICMSDIYSIKNH